MKVSALFPIQIRGYQRIPSLLTAKVHSWVPKNSGVLELGSADCLEFWRYLVVRSAHGKPTSTTCPSSTAHSGSYRSLSSACFVLTRAAYVPTYLYKCPFSVCVHAYMYLRVYVCIYTYAEMCTYEHTCIYTHRRACGWCLTHHVAEYVFLCLSIYARACVDRRCVYAGDVCLRQCSYVLCICTCECVHT